jgi:hypothetical protein
MDGCASRLHPPPEFRHRPPITARDALQHPSHLPLVRTDQNPIADHGHVWLCNIRPTSVSPEPTRTRSPITATCGSAAPVPPPSRPNRPEPDRRSRPDVALEHPPHLRLARTDQNPIADHGQMWLWNIRPTPSRGLKTIRSAKTPAKHAPVPANCAWRIKRMFGGWPGAQAGADAARIVDTHRLQLPVSFCPDRPKHPAAWTTAVGGCGLGCCGVAKTEPPFQRPSSLRNQAYRPLGAHSRTRQMG